MGGVDSGLPEVSRGTLGSDCALTWEVRCFFEVFAGEGFCEGLRLSGVEGGWLGVEGIDTGRPSLMTTEREQNVKAVFLKWKEGRRGSTCDPFSETYRL